jgi:hypothetical protein
MELPEAIADLGPFEYDSKHRTWTADGLLRGNRLACAVRFEVVSASGLPPQPDQRMREAFEECRRNWETLEPQLCDHVVQAFRELVEYQPERLEETGLTATATEQEILAHAGQPVLTVSRSIYTPRHEDYEIAVHFPVGWDDEHGLEIPITDGRLLHGGES